MTRIITADSASRRSARSSVKSPEVIQVKSVWLICRLSDGMPASASTCITETTNESAITPEARPPDTAFGRRSPNERVDEEAGERKQRNQRQHAVTTSAT